MKRRKTFTLILAAVVFGIFSYMVSGFVFRLPDKTAKAPTIQAIDQNFPDVSNDPAYTLIFNDKALDPTLPVQIGGSNNNRPFTGQ